MQVGKQSLRILRNILNRTNFFMQIFVNLPVLDLKKAVHFYETLGFTLNPAYTDDTAACVVLSDTIFVMLITHEKFATFVKKPIASSETVEVINAISLNDRVAVDEMKDKALSAGGKVHREPQEYGWMYVQSLEDVDGHIWEFCWIDAAQAQK